MAYLIPVFARRTVTKGVEYRPGDAVPDGVFSEHRLEQLRSLGRIKDLPVDGDPPEGLLQDGVRYVVIPVDEVPEAGNADGDGDAGREPDGEPTAPEQDEPPEEPARARDEHGRFVAASDENDAEETAGPALPPHLD